MAKTLIFDVESKNHVPFLRGILARSLSVSGLSFKVAYELATEIRQELSHVDETSSLQLREMVVKKLEQQNHHDIAERYQSPAVESPVIFVENLDGQLTPYSNENFSRLEIIGLSSTETSQVINKIYNHLIHSGFKKIHVNHLGYLTYRCLYQDSCFGPKVADRYLSWVKFCRSGSPLILLIGGTAGCGKSTISTALASRLNIVRTQSTDLLREVMRMMIPKRLLPVLHESSFNAWQTLPAAQMATADDHDKLLIAGYQTQAELLSVPCEAVMQRAVSEKISLLLEGVHIEPSLLKMVPADSSAVVVHIMLAVLKQKELKKRIKGRHLLVPDRASLKHPATFQDIWKLQEHLLDEADQADMAIVENMEKETTLREIMKIVMKEISRNFSTTPAEVFGDQSSSSDSCKNNRG